MPLEVHLILCSRNNGTPTQQSGMGFPFLVMCILIVLQINITNMITTHSVFCWERETESAK